LPLAVTMSDRRREINTALEADTYGREFLRLSVTSFPPRQELSFKCKECGVNAWPSGEARYTEITDGDGRRGIKAEILLWEGEAEVVCGKHGTNLMKDIKAGVLTDLARNLFEQELGLIEQALQVQRLQNAARPTYAAAVQRDPPAPKAAPPAPKAAPPAPKAAVVVVDESEECTHWLNKDTRKRKSEHTTYTPEENLQSKKAMLQREMASIDEQLKAIEAGGAPAPATHELDHLEVGADIQAVQRPVKQLPQKQREAPLAGRTPPQKHREAPRRASPPRRLDEGGMPTSPPCDCGEPMQFCTKCNESEASTLACKSCDNPEFCPKCGGHNTFVDARIEEPGVTAQLFAMSMQ